MKLVSNIDSSTKYIDNIITKEYCHVLYDLDYLQYNMGKLKTDKNVIHVFFQTLIDDAKFWDVEDNLDEFYLKNSKIDISYTCWHDG